MRPIYLIPGLIVSFVFWAAIIWATCKYGWIVPSIFFLIISLFFYNEFKSEVKRVSAEEAVAA